MRPAGGRRTREVLIAPAAVKQGDAYKPADIERGDEGNRLVLQQTIDKLDRIEDRLTAVEDALP